MKFEVEYDKHTISKYFIQTTSQRWFIPDELKPVKKGDVVEVLIIKKRGRR